MRTSIEKLLIKAKDARLLRQPKWVRDLVHELAWQIQISEAAEEGMRGRLETEMAAARALLNEGPKDSDTFLFLSNELADTSDEENDSYRPLGTGVTVEFRRPGDGPAEGFSVRLTEKGLVISGINKLAVVPDHSTSVTVITH